MAIVIGDLFKRSLLNDNVKVAPGAPEAGLLWGAKIHLFKNDVTLNRSTLLAALTEADYTGYAASAAIVWGAGSTDVDGNSRISGDNKHFLATGALADAKAYGYYVTNSAGTVLLFAEKFAAPVDMSYAGAGIDVVPVFSL